MFHPPSPIKKIRQRQGIRRTVSPLKKKKKRRTVRIFNI